METKQKLGVLSLALALAAGGTLVGCSGQTQSGTILRPGGGGSGGGKTGSGSGGSGQTTGNGNSSGAAGFNDTGSAGSGGSGETGGTGGNPGTGNEGGSSSQGSAGTMGGDTGGTTGKAGTTGTGGTQSSMGTGGASGGAGGGQAGGGEMTNTGPINVLIWNNALAYGHASRVGAIQYLKMRESTDNIKFDTTYAHTGTVQDGPSDTTFDASVFTDQGLSKYDVVFFLDTTGTTIDDTMKTVRRQALQDFIEKKGKGFVGTHSATDTYQNNSWPWYVDFIGANFKDHSNAGTSGTEKYYQNQNHPILTAAMTPNPWNRSEEWYTFTRDPLSSTIPGITILTTCHDTAMSQERDHSWVHEMPMATGGTQQGRLFYTASGHATSAFQEKAVMDYIIAGIKWAAHRL